MHATHVKHTIFVHHIEMQHHLAAIENSKRMIR
jgi:hypothetical protein